MRPTEEQRDFLTKILGSNRVDELVDRMKHEVFSGPVDLMTDLDPESLVEVEIAGPNSSGLQLELLRELRGTRELETHEYCRRGLDFPQIVYLAGAAGGIAEGIDIVWRWYSAKRRAGLSIIITLRSKRGGELHLNAHNLAEAQQLLARLKQLFQDEAPRPKRNNGDRAGRRGSGTSSNG